MRARWRGRNTEHSARFLLRRWVRDSDPHATGLILTDSVDLETPTFTKRMPFLLQVTLLYAPTVSYPQCLAVPTTFPEARATRIQTLNPSHARTRPTFKRTMKQTVKQKRRNPAIVKQRTWWDRSGKSIRLLARGALDVDGNTMSSGTTLGCPEVSLGTLGDCCEILSRRTRHSKSRDAADRLVTAALETELQAGFVSFDNYDMFLTPQQYAFLRKSRHKARHIKTLNGADRYVHTEVLARGALPAGLEKILRVMRRFFAGMVKSPHLPKTKS